MTKREPFAGVELESEEIGWLVKVADETICSGDGFWEKLDAEQMAARINAAHEARVKEEVKKAVTAFKDEVTSAISRVCGSDSCCNHYLSEAYKAVLSIPTEPEVE